MPRKQTPEEKKARFDAKWAGRLSDELVTYKDSDRVHQKLICLVKDSVHRSESKLYDEDRDHVIFPVTWSNLMNHNSGCPVCAEVQRRISKRVDETEILNRIANHRNNHPSYKTVMKPPYIGRFYKHTFICGYCKKDFERRVDDILRENRSPYCFTCMSRIFLSSFGPTLT